MRAASSVFRAGLIVGAFLSSAAFAQGSAVLTGIVTDAATGTPVADAVVTVTSPNLQGEELVVTDSSGLYRIPQLPPGVYELRLEHETYKPFKRADITLRVDRTIRLNVQLQPEAILSEEIVVVGRSPTVDVGSTTTGLNVGKDFINNIPFLQPNASGTRSFEGLAAAAPQVNADLYGFGINGSTSPENAIMIDGISVNDPAFGVNGANLPVDFIEELNVITGAYMPEFGRSMGGVLNAVTKSGSNEFHGSVFGNFTPGLLSGPTPQITRAASTFTGETRAWNSGDFGVELGGPILKDRLWFYAGFSPSVSRTRTRRTINQLRFARDENGNYLQDADGRLTTPELDGEGNQAFDPVPDGTAYRFNDSRALNYLAKLTLQLTQNQNLTLSASGSPKTTITPAFNEKLLAGTKTVNDNVDVSLKYTAGFLDKHLLVDATAGWHHQLKADLPDDGSVIGSTSGAAAVPNVILRKSDPVGYGIREVETLSPSASGYCDPAYPELCPVSSASNEYNIGGAAQMRQATLDRFQGKLNLTFLLQALGHHVFKAGADVARTNYDILKAYGGGVQLRDNGSGSAFYDYRRYAYLTGPDQLVSQDPPGIKATPSATELGAFVQDSWSILDVFTINAGLRYDQQYMYAGDGSLGLALNNQLSPRVGFIYDFTQRGQSKIFGSYARYYESVPLDIADRSLTGEYQTGYYNRIAPQGGAPGCNPIADINQALHQCRDPGNRTVLASGADPSQKALVSSNGTSPIDPNLIPQNGDEFVGGAEYEVIQDGRIGLTYTKRWMNAVVEDMSRDEGTTYFIGNPGYGISKDFPRATRNYDAVTVYFSKSFSDLWQAQASYTWSSLRGNYSGLFRPENGQLDPNINADFDLVSLLANRTGPLPGDRTHVIKAFAAREFVVNGSFSLVLGVAYTGKSGTPINYLASHPIYGDDQSFVLPRGSGGRTPWTHSVDGKLSAVIKPNSANAVTLSVDVFNMFNFQGYAQVDQRLSQEDVLPYQGKDPQTDACLAGSNPTCKPALKKYALDDNGVPIGAVPVTAADYNPNYKRVIAYQPPLTVRFGLKVAF